MSVTPRLNRLLAADGRCFDVAIDHGFFGEAAHLPGIEDLERALATVIDAAPDAIQLSPGQARRLQERAGRKPALVLRTDVANVYGRPLPKHLFNHLIEDPVGQAIRLDAACVVGNLLALPGEPAVIEQCLDNLARMRAWSEPAGMPLMIEPLVMKGSSADGYGVDGDLKRILPLVRQAVELGADVIKADPCDDLSQYHEVVEIAGRVPVLVRGGGRVSDQEIFQRTHTVMQQGARGIVYGRNVLQHPRPAAITRALMAMVHESASVQQALALVAE